MKTYVLFLVAVLISVFGSTSAQAQENSEKNSPQQDVAEVIPVNRHVDNIELVGLDGKPTMLPYYGEKNVLVFYVDPDKHKQNDEFIRKMEEEKFAAGANIEGFGIINLKDTLFPNSIVRFLARKRTEKNGATIITDEDNIIEKSWGLGDCNNMFVLMIVSREGELVFCRKGELSKQDQEDFIRIVTDYR